jgi:hypothetical protein
MKNSSLHLVLCWYQIREFFLEIVALDSVGGVGHDRRPDFLSWSFLFLFVLAGARSDLVSFGFSVVRS